MFTRFYFLVAYTTSIFFYLLLDRVIRSSAVNLHLAFDLGFAHHRCRVSVHRCVAAGASQTTHLDAVDRLTASLTALMQAHLPRHASAAAAAGSNGDRRSVSQLLVTLQIII